jgi:hypothetical protein
MSDEAKDEIRLPVIFRYFFLVLELISDVWSDSPLEKQTKVVLLIQMLLPCYAVNSTLVSSQSMILTSSCQEGGGTSSEPAEYRSQNAFLFEGVGLVQPECL